MLTGYKPDVGFKCRLPVPPGERMERLRFFLYSCANWGFGFFNAYDVGSRYNLDFWVHLGDYVRLLCSSEMHNCTSHLAKHSLQIAHMHSTRSRAWCHICLCCIVAISATSSSCSCHVCIAKSQISCSQIRQSINNRQDCLLRHHSMHHCHSTKLYDILLQHRDGMQILTGLMLCLDTTVCGCSSMNMERTTTQALARLSAGSGPP